jgi:hypothetical protein
MKPQSNISARAGLAYFDLVIEIEQGANAKYSLKARSQASEARGTMELPISATDLEIRLRDLQIALLESASERRRIPSRAEKDVRSFGSMLFDALINGELRSLYDLSRESAAQHGRGVRLVLNIRCPELASLPWEYMHDGRNDEYVCLSRNTPILRYLELPYIIKPLTVKQPPLRILGMIASPKGYSSLDVESEKKRLQNPLRGLQRKGLVELHWLEGQSWRALQSAMRSKSPWHVFHFVGHGGFDHREDEGVIILADESDRPEPITATGLGRILADHKSLRLVILNACEGARGGEQDLFSSTASSLMRHGIPAVLAMQYAITDKAAIEFSGAFYEALADGLPVDASVVEARKAISLAIRNSVEWGVPVLHMRSADGVLFNLHGKFWAIQDIPSPSNPDEQNEVVGTTSEWDKDINSLKTILEYDPSDSENRLKLAQALLARAQAYERASKFKKIISELNDTIASLDPNQLNVHKTSITSFDWKSDHDNAIADYKRLGQIIESETDAVSEAKLGRKGSVFSRFKNRFTSKST